MGMFPSDNTEDEQALFSPDEQTLLKRIARSEVWRLIEDALVKAREDLFAGTSSIHGLAGQPTTNESLWAHRGATLLVQHLLREGPLFVIWSRRQKDLDKEEKATKRPKGVKVPEREYNPAGIEPEKPDFDI